MSAEDAVIGQILREGPLAPTAFMVAFNQFVAEHVPEHPLAIQKTVLAYNELLEYLPHGYFVSLDDLRREANAGYERPPIYVPLYELLTNVGEAIYNFAGTFFHKELRDAGLFRQLRNQLTQNENAASGITNADRVLGRKDVINAYEHKAEPKELIWIYLKHTPFYELFQTPMRQPAGVSVEEAMWEAALLRWAAGSWVEKPLLIVGLQLPEARRLIVAIVLYESGTRLRCS